MSRTKLKDQTAISRGQ